MKILVIGGTGTVGSQVVRELLARKATEGTISMHGRSSRFSPCLH